MKGIFKKKTQPHSTGPESPRSKALTLKHSLPETRPRLKQIKKGKEGVENVKKGARTILIRQTLRSRATDEGRSTIFFLPKLLVIADPRSH